MINTPTQNMLTSKSIVTLFASSSTKLATRRLHLTKMSSCKRDLNNETDGDECLTKYNYFYNPNLLKDKVAFITGGGSGIGFRISELFMRHGCKTAIASRSLERVSAAAKKLTDATKVECLPLAADIRNPEQIETAMDACLNEFGKIDILINSAAGNFLSPIGNLSYNAFKTVMDIDTNGTFNASKAAYDKYFKDHGGNIINITATLHYRGRIMQCHAGSAKAAIGKILELL